MRYQGRITRWKDEQGYGFIVPSQGGDEVFVHIKAFRPRQARPAGDEIVTYELIRDANGRPRAEAVAFASGAGRRSSTSEAGPSRFPLLLAMLFFCLCRCVGRNRQVAAHAARLLCRCQPDCFRSLRAG